MSVLRRPGPRFVAEAVLIVLTAVVAGLAQLGVWTIIAIMVAVLAAVWIFESLLSRSREPAATAVVVPEPAPELVPHVRVLSTEPLPEPEPEPRPEPAPVASRSAAPGAPWNIWELERLLREQGVGDEERTFLLHYLRDYAGPDGALPAEFDDLVREAFGDLLGAPAA